MPLRRRSFAAHQDIIVEGEAVSSSCFIDEGFVSRTKTARDGAQQIVAFHIAGDMVDLQSALLLIADHGVHTHAPTVVNYVAHDDIIRIAAAHPDLARAFWFDTLVDASVSREWTMNVGRRSATQAVAHLLLELAYRLKRAGLSDGLNFELPLTQADLADATGISIVHCNRSLQSLRRDGMISTHGKQVTLEDREGLAGFADFDDLYLHPEGPRKPAGAALVQGGGATPAPAMLQ